MKTEQFADNKPMIVIEHNGPTSNAFYVMGLTARVLSDLGGKGIVQRYMDEAAEGGYETLLTITRKYVNLILV